MDLETDFFLKGLPKVELHFHLEGAIPIECIYQLAKKYNGEKYTLNELRNRYSYKDFPSFIETWHWQAQFLKEYDDFTYIAKNIAKNLIDQNIKYVEAEITPADYANKHTLSKEGIIEAVRKGLNEYDDKIVVNILYGLNRDLGHDFAMKQLLETVVYATKYGVIGISLGGSEHLYPAKNYKKVYFKAKDLGLRTTIHAGEYSGADSIWDGILVCKAERIGHCTSAIKDQKLVEYLRDHQIHCELNPVSNLMTKVIDSYKKHPVKYYYENNLNLSINTDDPSMFNTSLFNEYKMLITEMNFTLDDIKKILLMTINSSWADDFFKINYINELNKYYHGR